LTGRAPAPVAQRKNCALVMRRLPFDPGRGLWYDYRMNAADRTEIVYAKVRAAAEALGKDPDVLEALSPRNLDVIIPQLSIAFEEKLRLMLRELALRFEEGLRDVIPVEDADETTVLAVPDVPGDEALPGMP
jgi:hypothetical protein